MIPKQKTMKIRLGSILLIIGVLLIAYAGFRMFTSTLSSPTSIELFMPRDSEKDSVDQYSAVKTKLTLILLKDDNVFGYYGDSLESGRSVPVAVTGELITEGWKKFSKDSLVILIKPANNASYKTTVAILDEMTIKHIEKYSMTDLDKKEKEFLKIVE